MSANRPTLDQQLIDGLTDGHLTQGDADAVQTFRLFLSESGPPGEPHDDAWRKRWLAYVCGLADGPTSDAEYAELLPQIRAMKRAPATEASDD